MGLALQKEKEDAVESLRKIQAEKQQVADSTGALQAANEQLRTTVQDLKARVHTSLCQCLSLHALSLLVPCCVAPDI